MIRQVASLRRSMSSTANIFDLTPEMLVQKLSSMGVATYRARQVHHWIYARGVTSFDAMRDLPQTLRQQLSETFHVGSMNVHTELKSRDGTIKRAYSLRDGQLIETVLMPYSTRHTACISSQVGCAMKCAFCATGQMGFSRQLSSSEIFEQVARLHIELLSCRATQTPRRLTNIVFMGMGEPLSNYNNVITAVRRIVAELNIGARHITISTVGVAPRIRHLADEGLQVNLAVSLHQTSDAKRSALLPVNNKYPISELLEACRYYINKTNRRISFEWALIEHSTDSIETAHELADLLQGLLCHVNVIPLNPTKGFSGEPSSRQRVDAFVSALRNRGIPASVRMRRGIDVDAGCGQLKADIIKRQKKFSKEDIDSTSNSSKITIPKF